MIENEMRTQAMRTLAQSRRRIDPPESPIAPPTALGIADMVRKDDVSGPDHGTLQKVGACRTCGAQYAPKLCGLTGWWMSEKAGDDVGRPRT